MALPDQEFVAAAEPPVPTRASDVPKAKILVVDDDERTAMATASVLEDLGQTLVVVHSGEEALRYLLRNEVAVILLDVQMPGMDGYETAALIRSRRRTRHIPIVFLTAVFRDDSHLLQAYSAGAVDMVFKPVDPFILKSKISVFVDLYLKQIEIQREAELRHLLQRENFRVRAEKLSAEEALRRSRERQQVIFQSLPVCVCSRSTTPPYRALFISDNVEQLTGFPARRFLEEAEFGLSRVHPDDLPRVIDAMRSATAGRAYSCEFRWRGADGKYRILFDQGVLAPSEDGEPREIFGTIVDISEQRELQQQLAQAQKMETVGQLTGGVAHDFNNLLTVILGNADLLLRQTKTNERKKRQLLAVRMAAERGRSLTGQLLAYSRRQHLKPEVFDVNDRICAFEPLLRQALGENISLKFERTDQPITCEVDPAQFETSLLNLTVNARDAMPTGGELVIAVRRAESAEGVLEHFGGTAAGPWAAIEVADTGAGMSQDIAARAFEPFFTTKANGKGSGLGLSQVYGFVRQSGGHVAILSTPGAGTKLSIYLPLSTKPIVAAPPAEKPRESAGEKSGTVLLVEDDSAVLAVARDMLSEIGYRVITAPDANAAIDILRQNKKIDLLFTDVVMPGGKTGVQLAAAAQELRPGIKILLTSGYVGEALSRHNPESLGLPLIAKPFERGELETRIQDLLGDSVAAVAGAPAAGRSKAQLRASQN